jgi:hypothetical protein
MDFINDQSGRHLLRLDTLVTVPDFVKSASLDLDEIAALTDHQFADPVRREFPIHTPGHAYLSYGYYKSAGIKDSSIFSRLKGAARLHQIEDHVAKLEEAFGNAVKAASQPERMYAVQIDFGPANPESEHPMVKQGGVQGFYPMRTAHELETSAQKLANDRLRIPMETFVDGCRNLVKRAQVLRVPVNLIPRSILMYGEDRLPDLAHVKFAAEKRTRQTNDPIYQQIAEVAEAEPDRPVEDFIGLWKQADDQNLIQWGRHMEDPWQIFNSGPLKQAYHAQLNRFTLLADQPVPVDAIARIPEARVQRHFLKDAAAKVLEVIKKAATLDGPDMTNALSELDHKQQISLLKLVTT